MSKLTVWQNGICRELECTAGAPLWKILLDAGYETVRPCGGNGTCGKCTVSLSGQVSAPNAQEQKARARLACQTRILGDATVILPDSKKISQIETAVHLEYLTVASSQEGYGAALDIGTTTLAMQLYDLTSGKCLAQATSENPQRAVATDVMGRIGAALAGQGALLQQQIETAAETLLAEVCRKAAVEKAQVSQLVVTGNTTMLYLLTGQDPNCLSHAPFEADTLFDLQVSFLGIPTYLPPCMNAFVGADITCAVFAAGMCEDSRTALLCDIGTNGELALWKGRCLYVTSTAAGPAFEGAGISCGISSIPGAIDRVWVEQDSIQVHTIGGAPAVGLCGSGLLDAIAAGLQLEAIDETGAMDDPLSLAEGVALQPKDVRAVQLAKAAIAAGIQTLLETAGISASDVEQVFIAGGFGSHLDVENAAYIGLIPTEFLSRVSVIGNAALSGAIAILLDESRKETVRQIARSSSHINLGGNPRFNEHYMEQMFFETDLPVS
ncbi:MAG: DUF4445 domain-containing protein [Oscillospiraceae bacterium]|nr:DUF4445 domain-containing protein [Oscillospiraceae bacterium]